MRLTGMSLVTSATGEPLDVEDAKQHLRIEKGETAENEYIGQLCKVARSVVEDMTNRKCMPQTWKMTFDGWPTGSYVDIPVGPLSSIPSSGITYKLSTGNSTQLGSTAWGYSTQEHTPRVYLEYGQSWPSETLNPIDPVAFECKVGYPSSSAVPERMKLAMKMLVSHWYENREPYLVGQTITHVPDAVDRLLYDLRLWEF